MHMIMHRFRPTHVCGLNIEASVLKEASLSTISILRVKPSFLFLQPTSALQIVSYPYAHKLTGTHLTSGSTYYSILQQQYINTDP